MPVLASAGRHRGLRLVGAAVTLGALAAALGAPTAAHADLPGASPVLTRAPYLTDLTPTSVRVTWATATRSRQTVRYGPLGDCTANSVTSATLGTTMTVNGVTEYNNSVTVPNLSPDTPYCYRVFTGDATPVDLLGTNPSPSFTTRVPDGSSAPFTFAVLGDWGDTTSNGVNSGAVNQDQANVLSRLAASGARFTLSTGDVAYPSGSQTNYGDLQQSGVNISGVFAPEYYAAPGQKVPMFSLNGNHGRTATLLLNWPQPSVTAASNGVYSQVSYPSFFGSNPATYPTTYYAFTSGGVRFYMLDTSWSDSNTGTADGNNCNGTDNCAVYQVDAAAHWTPTSAEYQWLQQDLAAHPGGVKVAAFHFPLRSDDPTEPDDEYLKNNPGSTDTLEQLLHDNGVDLVFNGHAHIYQRNVAPPGGVPSYVTGGGGAKLTSVGGRGCDPTDAYAIGWSYSSNVGRRCPSSTPVPASDANVHHFLLVSVDGSTLTVTPTDSLGNTFDAKTYDFSADGTAPSPPSSLTVTRSGSTTMRLTWGAATDDRQVASYDVYRDGTYMATVPQEVLAFSDKTAVCPASYAYEVRARDLAGNVAGTSNSVTC
ncbi:metallophosphoesterase family protein [Streptomyces sp. NK15101]|uniref:purple acid phosphatase family protein n=1 Tax=Streptomyces sp. NK15101 TaxID=2873261 RepID=UPI001CEDBF35|nr:metallophosphoesterase family protein [Streptomyces sp. NK15101]